MTGRSVLARLADILDAIDGIESSVKDLSFQQFEESWLVLNAVVRGIEVISEASRHIPEELRSQHPNIPWRKIAAIGNVLRHEYDRIDPDIVWSVVVSDLQPLRSAVEAVAEIVKQSN